MKIFTPDEVKAKVKEFNELLAREMKLQQEILTLKISGSRDQVRKNQQRHDAIIAEINDIRFNGMIPILTEMMEFISHCQKLEKEGKLKLNP